MRERGTTGVQTHISALREYLSVEAYPHALLTPLDEPAWRVYPVFGLRRVLGLFSRSLDVWWYRRWHFAFLHARLKRVLRDGAPTTVYAQCPLSARAALLARTSRGQKVVLAVHFNQSQADEWVGKHMISTGGRLYGQIIALEKEILAAVDGIVFLSGYMKSFLEQKGLVPARQPSLQIPNFCFSPASPACFRQEWSGDMVSIGSLEKRKNQAFLIRVVAALKNRGGGHRLDLIGDGPERQSLETLARNLGVGNMVRFLGYRERASQLLCHYRVYAHSAILENMPYTLIEALGCGLPILAGAVGGIPEIFEPGREGFFWPLDDPEEAARVAAHLLENETLRSRLSMQARKRFAEQFAAEKNCASLQKFLTLDLHQTPAMKG